MITHLQSFFATAGSESCYALNLIDVAREYIESFGLELIGNELDYLEHGTVRGFIDFNWKDYSDMQRGFFVKDPCGFLKMITGVDWYGSKEARDYKPKPGDYIIDFWAKTEENGRKGIGHFNRENHDSLQNSQTVKNGFIYSKRVFRVK